MRHGACMKVLMLCQVLVGKSVLRNATVDGASTCAHHARSVGAPAAWSRAVCGARQGVAALTKFATSRKSSDCHLSCRFCCLSLRMRVVILMAWVLPWLPRPASGAVNTGGAQSSPGRPQASRAGAAHQQGSGRDISVFNCLWLGYQGLQQQPGTCIRTLCGAQARCCRRRQ